jgi:hypothetical protein
VGTGRTQAGSTAWQPWVIGPRHTVPLGLQVRVDTSAAGFTERPCYFAWLQWPGVASAHLPAEAYLGLGLQYVQEEEVDGFTFRVVLDGADLPWGGSRPAADANLTLARTERLHVLWLGLQTEEQGSSG